jgi:hypothetical protein
VKLDLQALEQEMGFAVGTTRAWWQRLLLRRGRIGAVQSSSCSS